MLVAGAQDGTRAVVNRFYCAIDRRDEALLARVLAPELVWDVPAPAGTAPLRGREAALRWLAAPLPAAYAMQRTGWTQTAPDVVQVTGMHLHTGADLGVQTIAFVHRVRVAGGQVVGFHEHLPDGLLRAHVALRAAAPA